MQPTATQHDLPLRPASFHNLTEALDYAARGETGMNFFNARGGLYASLPYRDLAAQAKTLARRLHALGLPQGSPVALVAETNPDFVRFFFACQYAGLVPVPLPMSVNLGNHRAYVNHLRGLLADCQPEVAMAPSDLVPLVEEAAAPLGKPLVADAAVFDGLPETDVDPLCPEPTDLACVQYTSGSTRFPRGVMVRQATLLNNLAGIIRYGVKVRTGDRCVSWLPFYHDLIIINGRNIWPQDLEQIAEQQPEARPGDSLAFSVPCPEGSEQAILVVQCRESDPAKRNQLERRLKARISEVLAIDCVIALAPLHTLPRTSSCKLSRSGARRDYIEVANDLDSNKIKAGATPKILH